MAVVTAWKRTDLLRKTRVVMMKMTYASGDTSVVVNTGLKRIFSFNISPTSVTAKKVDFAAVSGGTLTLTVADPLADCYLFVTARGI